MAIPTYLPAPIKVEYNRTDREPNHFLWAGSSIALGILSYYAPKTFLATSVGIFAYQVHRFNQLTDDYTEHQHIHAWTINACMVMSSIGAVFVIKALPYFWSAAKDLRHLHLIHCVGHLAKGLIMIAIPGSLMSFRTGAIELASRCRWIEMEDYVENYPMGVKKEILSSYRNQFAFYISALLPQTGLATRLSRINFAFSQFQPEENKFSILQNYFKNIDMTQWPLAIHQFQQLSIKKQLAIAPQLAAKAAKFSEEDQNKFPDDIKAVILNETLRGFTQVPQESDDHKWQDFVSAFEKLDRKSQSILGYELAHLVQTVPLESIDKYFSETMRLAALLATLKSWGDLNSHLTNQSVFVPIANEDILFDSLSIPFREEFSSNLRILVAFGSLEEDMLSEKMQAVLAGRLF